MPFLIQVLLPQTNNEGEPFGDPVFSPTRRELVERFGGLTAHVRAPARGLWKEDDGTVVRDEIVIFEVMADELDRDWWAAYRATLEIRFAQAELLIRAHAIERV